jgi:hypothetical protein
MVSANDNGNDLRVTCYEAIHIDYDTRIYFTSRAMFEPRYSSIYSQLAVNSPDHTRKDASLQICAQSTTIAF